MRDWRDGAACRDATGIDWFPVMDQRGMAAKENLARAREVCDSCCVKGECYAAVMADPHAAGIWAGTTEAQRRHTPKGRPPRRVRETRCGSAAGYMRHRRAGETPCDACREAHAIATRLRKHRLEIVR